MTLPLSKTPVRESLPGARRGGKLSQGHTAGLRGSLLLPPTSYLRRFPVGLRPQMPQKAEGKRMLPPMSVPKPSGEPPAAMRAPSPPEEPPGLLEEFHGFMVGPKRGLLQSKLEEAGRGQPLSCWYQCPCPPRCTPGTQPEHGLGDIGVHEGQGALQLQHLHQHTVTLRWHPLVQAQAQCRVLALEGRMGERDMVDEPGGLQHTGSAPTTTPQAKPGHTCGALSRPLDLGLPLRVTQDPELAGRDWGRAHLVAEAFLEAHGDTIEQALSWDLAQLSLTVCQVADHTVSPFVDFPGLGEGEKDIRGWLLLFFQLRYNQHSVRLAFSNLPPVTG